MLQEQRIADVRAIYEAAVRAVQARTLLRQIDLDEHLRRPLSAYRRMVVLGAGKASMAMAGALEEQLGEAVMEGIVVVPHGYRQTLPGTERMPHRIEVVEAGHPVPDEVGLQAATRALEKAEACGADDLVLVLISGGGSALWPAVAPGLALADVQAVSKRLLESGAAIQEINAVRKHLSRIKGGRLAAAAYPADVLALVLSDVVGNDLSTIASGPTVPDAYTFGQAVDVLRRYALWDRVPEAVRAHLASGVEDPTMETPKPGSEIFEQTRTVLIGSNRTALEAARREADVRGYDTQIVADGVTGEAREVGRELARVALDPPDTKKLASDVRPVCLIWGGETTVTVRGDGRGGRNQEVALAAALALDGAPREVVFLSGGTDGIDGPTDAAGAWSTPQTVSEARQRGLDPEAFLQNNDAYSFFEALGALLKPGPTHTNVMDIQVALIPPN